MIMNIETQTWTTVVLEDGTTQSGMIPHTVPVSNNELDSGKAKAIALRSSQNNVCRMFSDGIVLSAITANAVLWSADGDYVRELDWYQ
jgi:hypothetical protein